MKANVMCLVGVSLAAIADSSVAQEYVAPRGALGTYDGYYEYDAPVPTRPVPNYARRQVETVVTTTRRIITQPGYVADEPAAVVTTRRVIAPSPVYPAAVDVVTTGSVGHPSPIPPRPISKDAIFAPAERVVTTRRVAPAPPVIIEERRVETTRRIIRPGVEDWE